MALRALYGAGAALALGAAIMTFALPDEMRDQFAWPISPSLSAATIGASYCAAVALLTASTRARTWAEARLAAPPVMAISLLLLAVTLIHWDRFERANVVFWLWLAAYVLVPPVLAVLIWHQLRAAGSEPRPGARMPRWARIGLIVHTAILLGVGALLFAFPGTAEELWPWSLTPLTSRAIGAFVLGFGVTAAYVAWDDELTRLRGPALAYSVLAAAALVALARFGGELDLDQPGTWIYVAFLVTAFAGGVAMLMLAITADRSETGSRDPAQG